VTDDAVQALLRRLPGLPVRTQLEQLLRDHGGLVQALDAARVAQNSRQAEYRALEGKLQSLTNDEVSPALRAALEAAQARGDMDGALRKSRMRVDMLQAEWQQAMVSLGTAVLPLEQLRTVDLPS